jgi:Predicted nucleotide-binding protein containing TIR-like domain
MRLAIIGGWGQDDNEFVLSGDKSCFRDFCRQLGRRLAENKQGVIVGSEEDNSADRYVVEGIVEVARKIGLEEPLIKLIPRPDGSLPFKEGRTELSRLFGAEQRSVQPVADAKLVAVQEARAVITIGGLTATFHAGLGSIFAGKRVVPVPIFGGASRKLFEFILSWRSGHGQGLTGADRDEFLGLQNDVISDELFNRILSIAGVNRLRIFIIHGHSNDRDKLRGWLSESKLAEAVILAEKFDEPGATIPEKLERAGARVDAAIALATPDDFGGETSDRSSVWERARQNVWLEIGWFWGRLGRSRVLVLPKTPRPKKLRSQATGKVS